MSQRAADIPAPARLLEVDGLSRTFQLRNAFGAAGEQIHAVADVSFGVDAGGTLAIVGESGSGKTTTARIIVGLESASAGVVRLNGRELSAHPKRRDRMLRSREIQMVFQNPYASLDPRQTAADAIAEVLSVQNQGTKSERATMVAEALAAVGLGAREGGRRPRELSGGQCQRVAIARALAVKPALLVLDEPVSALDVSTQAQILNLLADLRDRLSLAMLMVSHDLAVVRQVCDDVVVMRRGKVVESGPVDAVLGSPADAYTQLLLSSIPKPRAESS